MMLTLQQKTYLEHVIISAMKCLSDQDIGLGQGYFIKDIGEKLIDSTQATRVTAFNSELMKDREVVA